jgi:hypothetical protein
MEPAQALRESSLHSKSVETLVVASDLHAGAVAKADQQDTGNQLIDKRSKQCVFYLK